MATPDHTEIIGWGWFDTTPGADGAKEPDEQKKALTLAAARCFRGDDGERVLGYLRAVTLERALGPGATDTQLRHLEGQRQLVVHIASLIERGRTGG